jgi:hypothetical protein
MSDPQSRERAQRYAEAKGVGIDWEHPIGSGNDGAVWRTTTHNAVKVFFREDTYERELAAYQRLRSRNVLQIKQFNIPRLVDFDDSLLIIEMQIVAPPYLLDFGKAYVDFRPEYSQDALDCWEEQYKELWGEERWKEVRRALATLTLVGIYYQDPTPRNIHFGDCDDDD